MRLSGEAVGGEPGALGVREAREDGSHGLGVLRAQAAHKLRHVAPPPLGEVLRQLVLRLI